MRRIRINGALCALPFESLIPAHTGHELDDLRLSIRESGILQPIITYTSPAHGRAVLDGATRATIGGELGVAIPVAFWGELSDEQAKVICESLNYDRRHISAERQAARRKVRIEEVVRLRRQGASLRGIAASVAVSESQVRKDLAGAHRCAPEEEDEEEEASLTIGLDGKSYPATRVAKAIHADLPGVELPCRPELVAQAELRCLESARESLKRAGRSLAESLVLNGPRLGKLRAAMRKRSVPGFARGTWPIAGVMVDALTDTLA